jgi:hypothetical protein
MKSIFNKLNNFTHNVNTFYQNIWYFRKSLWNFRWYDYSYTLHILQDALKVMSVNLEKKGSEITELRMKKVDKINRVIEIIDNVKKTTFIELAEKELGELYDLDYIFEDVDDNPDYKKLVMSGDEEKIKHNDSVYKRAQEIEEEEWNELFNILKGPNINEYRKLKNPKWDKWYDGSGMNHWWD